jgi:hypothetical protein
VSDGPELSRFDPEDGWGPPPSRTREADRLGAMSDAQLFEEAAGYAVRLASAPEEKLFGIVMLLMAAAGAIASIIVARKALQEIRGEAARG